MAAEAAINDVKQLHDTHRRPLPVYHMNSKKKQQSMGKSGQSKTECHHCGGQHWASQCCFKDYECHYCKKRGHLASVCKKKKAQAKSEVDLDRGMLMQWKERRRMRITYYSK